MLMKHMLFIMEFLLFYRFFDMLKGTDDISFANVFIYLVEKKYF